MVEAQTNLTTMYLQFILIIITHYFGVDSPPICPLYEYRAEGSAGWWCCLSCQPGQYLVKDCIESIEMIITTECSSCPDGTFQAGYNEQKQCSNCTKCDAGLGLKVKKSCSSTSDVLCKPLDGFFCSDSNGGGCRVAQRHRLSCSAGYYIGQRGTADKDTECLHCTDGTFSNGTSSCQPHTTCDSVGGVQIKPGTDSTDSTCTHYVAIVFIIIGCILLISIIVLGAWVYRRRNMGKEKQGWRLHGGAAGERTAGPSSTPLLSTEPPAGLETSIPPAPSSETQPAGLETSIPPAPSSETQPAGLETSIPPAPSSETQPAGLETSIPPAPSSETQPAGLETSIPPAPSSETQPAGLETSIPPAPSSETQPAEETTPLRSTDGPEPTRDQQECTITIPDGTMDDHHGDQSLGPARPSSPTHNGSVSDSVHQEDHQPVLVKRDSGASQSSLHSLGLPSTSQSARRFRFRSKSESSCLENPKLSTDCVALLMDNDIADEEVTPVREYHDQPESESDDSNSLNPVPIRRDHGVSQVTPLIPSARRYRVRSKSVSSHFNIPRPRRRASLLKGNDIAEEEEWPVLEN
ncbi:tumor necrosis factor receptor superfamily member 3-like isoform X10 [Gadus macrocephalus]|uniref:tumor necrosis factor receptor superfamily member 3-like isoform X10 n=1 Tax=Gadus macrocephalus TaxID=80720 RepID=UPI0028CB23E7|nr:tumor necrosis factor receptor superfamily member 3-like isoform X10 [Gadus macrocephalus]